MGRKSIVEQLKEFRKELSKEVPITKMILFGSRAWGKPHQDSDIDLIIVSSKFKQKKSFERERQIKFYYARSRKRNLSDSLYGLRR